MIYCHECGEQVAENDTFCPYCGISLSPSVAVEEDNSMDKTIAVGQPKLSIGEKSEEAKPEADASDEEKISELSDADQLSEIAATKTEDFSSDVTAENLEMKTDQIEIPEGNSEDDYSEKSIHSDQELEEMENLFAADESNTDMAKDSGESINSESKKKNLQTVNPLVQPAPAASNNIQNDKSLAEPVEINTLENVDAKSNFISEEKGDVEKLSGEIETPQTESNLISYEETEVKEILSADKPEESADETISEIENKVPEMPQMRPRLLDDLSENKKTETSEPPISMPEMELPVTDSHPPSRFDSVSIMEKKESAVEASPSAEKIPSTEISSANKKNESESNERSFTQPIIGGNDTDGKNKTKLKPLNEGTVLNGRYEIVRKIGGGGMGAVYLASDKNLGGVLRAVKEMVQSYIEDAQQEKAVNDFKRESLLLTSLDHPAIPTIYDYFFDEKEARFYLVMKYISGGDLSSRLRSAPENRIDEAEVAKWSMQVADVLDYLHNRQPPIVYRDLKPANIMIDGNSGRVMLIDFGIARWVNKEEKGVTAVGTMGYAPPELFSGNVEARSDIYSLGSTMFHLLTGADPQSNPLLIFDFQKHPRPRQINPQLSDQMERILMRAVEYNADKRFASAATLRQALEEHIENQKSGKLTYGVKEVPASVALSDQPVFCGFCGQKIVATDMFCAFCGAKQPLAQQGIHSESYSPTPLTAQLLVIGTSELEMPSFKLEKEDNLVGRRDPQSNIFPEVDLSKYDPQTKISRRHARIWREGSEFMVEDLGSSNGTYILPVISDTMRLQPHQPQLLTNGDKIRLGDTTLHFVLG